MQNFFSKFFVSLFHNFYMFFHFYLSSIYICWSILYDYHTEKKRKCVCYVGLSMHINYRYINSVLKLGPVCWGKWKMKCSPFSEVSLSLTPKESCVKSPWMTYRSVARWTRLYDWSRPSSTQTPTERSALQAGNLEVTLYVYRYIYM